MHLYKRDRSPYWWWRWTPPGSAKQLRGSCRTSDKQEAERYAIRLQADWRQTELLGEVPAIRIDAAFSTLVTDHYAFKKSYRTPIQQLGVIKAIATRG